MSGEEAVDLLLWSDLDDDDEVEDDRLVQHSCNCKCSDNEENRRMINKEKVDSCCKLIFVEIKLMVCYVYC